MTFKWRHWAPRSLSARFALASAGLAAAATLLVAAFSWVLIDRQHSEAERSFAARDRQFHAANVGSTLRALATRMSEVANSTILATGLVDSAGKETYLAPFLNGVRQVNGIPVQVLFADFEGKAIASNTGASFTPRELDWVRAQLPAGKPVAQVLEGPAGADLVAFEPLRYSRTPTPEGAVLYKIALRDLQLEPGLKLYWGSQAAEGTTAAIDAPPIFAAMNFRLAGNRAARLGETMVPQYAAILLVALGVFAAVFVAGARLARLLTRDLSRLEAFSSRVMTAALSDQRAPAGSSAEVASLASSINQMLERLHEQHEALRREGEKLAKLAEALQAADRRKDEFLAMLAHELRNPLAPIGTGAELLKRLSTGDERMQRTADVIARQVKHITKLVDDLLDVSRVTRGLVVLDRKPVDARAVIAAAVDQVRPLADSRGHRLEVDLPDGALPILGDAARLTQVVSNLLHNACKFTPDGGRIEVSGRAEADQVVLRVTDNGSGISRNFLPEVFGLFTQGSRKPDRSQGGLGLGLALVKHMAELHGGSASADSPGLGLGSTFTVRLPRAEVLEAAGEAGPREDTRSRALRILVVDDNVDAAQTLRELLEMQGHSVTALFDAGSALAHAGSEQADVFILDIGLPGMDGNELARRIRSMPGAAGATLVALTGYGQDSDRRRSSEAGFDYHLVKPVDQDALARLLASLQEPGASAPMQLATA